MSKTVIDLITNIQTAAQRYYSGYPIISDNEFDTMVEELRSIDPNNELLTTTGWGFEPSKIEYGVKVNHLYNEVGSIDNKPRKVEDIPDKFKASNTRLRISAKLDGLSCVLYYENGSMIQAVTRGNGKVGIDVTNKIHYILRDDVRYRYIHGFTGAIRGELVISNENWKKIPVSEDPSKNPRNYASGLINRNSISDELKYVDLVVYKIIAWENCNEIFDLELITEKLNAYFKHTVDCIFINSGEKINQEMLEELFNKFREKYPCDGCVITNKKVEYNSNNPNFEYDEVAFKFESERAQTTVRGIEWNLSRTGCMKPIVLINPVTLDGAVINKCSGFNADFIVRHKIKEDTKLIIERSGCVIPDIQEVLVDNKWIKI